MHSWLYTNPRRLRLLSLACVIAGTVFYIRLIQTDHKVAQLVRIQGDLARINSETLGG